MSGIKYYQLKEDEELPDEFCAVKDVNGEPSEYTFYRPETENAKLREQMERLVTLLRVDCDIEASWDGLRKFWSIELTEGGCLMRDRACKIEAENAKLRELVRSFIYEHADYIADGNYSIGDLDLEHAMHHNQAYFRHEAKKLGVEVNE